MINPQSLELPMSRTVFHGLKDVRATEVRLYKQKRTKIEKPLCRKKSLMGGGGGGGGGGTGRGGKGAGLN